MTPVDVHGSLYLLSGRLLGCALLLLGNEALLELRAYLRRREVIEEAMIGIQPQFIAAMDLT